MANIKRFIPSLLSDSYDSEISEFETQYELLEIPFVKKLRTTFDGKPDKTFIRYSLDGNNLMVETCYGQSFIVGTITGKHNLTLPKWVVDGSNI